jgi:serine O-acetyltransferase
MKRSRKNAEAPDVLKDSVAALLPLYADTAEDRADSIVGSYPNSLKIAQALEALIDVLFPGKMSHHAVHRPQLPSFLRKRLAQVIRLLRPEIERALPFLWRGECARIEGAPKPCPVKIESQRILDAFLARLPDVRQLLIEDVKAAYKGDPAALTYAEVQLAYPGLLAIASHRLAHELYLLKVPLVPRIMSEWTHAKTGVDINPGARIGHGFFIDHATGVVIGETTEIGNNVKLYQGVTLGARSFTLDAQGNPVKHIKRHPTVEDDVVIYANATILGGTTVIGRGATIGGNVFIMESVPPYSVVSANHPELRIKRPSDPVVDFII